MPKTPTAGDQTRFDDEIAAACAAFATDVSYAVAMARAAVTITRKRDLWLARKELREAEVKARTRCADTGAFDCHAHDPCGTGDCKFAEGHLAALDIPTVLAAATERPQTHCTGPYNIDNAVEPLLALRAAR